MKDFTHISLDVIDDLDEWDIVVEQPPSGSRPKRTLERKSDRQLFVFKRPRYRREHQIWSELLGSFIAGDLLGWDVQHAAVGIREGKPGNLLRYIYQPDQYQPDQGEKILEGWRLCKLVDPEYDVDKGKRHTFPLLLRTHTDVIGPEHRIPRSAFMEFWSRAFALDTLISNTDRHAENWAIIESPTGNSRMAALFDNGSSMGCDHDTRGLDRYFDEDGRLIESKMEKFKRAGRHHCRLDKPGKQGASYEPLCRKLLTSFPEGRVFFEAVAAVDLRPVRALTEEIINRVQLQEPYAMTNRRAEHICAILHLGLERIRSILRE